MGRPYKAVILAGSLAAGGSERAAARIGSGLAERGHDVAVVTLQEDRAYPCTCDVHCLGVSIPHAPQGRRLVKSVHAAYRLARFCRVHGVDSVLAFGDICAFVQYLSCLLFLNKSRFIYCIRDNPWMNTTSVLMLRMVRFLCARAAKVVAVSEELAHMIRSNWRGIDPIAIPNGIDVREYRSAETDGATLALLKDRRFTFISIGSLTRQKNHAALIEAFAAMPDAVQRESKLWIVGEGVLRWDLERRIQDAHLDKSVRLVGWRDDTAALLRYSDCFVLSSLWEGMPNVVLEALAAGLRVIATDCRTGPREILAPGLAFDSPLQSSLTCDRDVLIPVREDGKDSPMSAVVPLLSRAMCEAVANRKSERSSCGPRSDRVDDTPALHYPDETRLDARFQMDVVLNRWSWLL